MSLTRRSAIAAGISILFPKAAFGLPECDVDSNDFHSGRVACEIGLSVASRYAPQSTPNLCWAACIQMAFLVRGFSVRQERVVENVFGKNIDRPASSLVVGRAINGFWLDDFGKVFVADCEVLFDAFHRVGKRQPLQQAAELLADNTACIIGASGHATILTKLIHDGRGPTSGRVEIWDPDPPGKFRLLEPREMATTTFLAGVNATGPTSPEMDQKMRSRINKK
jgi:hypothetical protein